MEEQIRRGLRALGLPEDGAAAMAVHGRMLLERNQVMNLTALRTEEEVAALHILDSAALLAVCSLTADNRISDGTAFSLAGKTVVDVGSGGGFPGLPLRLAEPSIRLTLLDAQRKRVDFLREVCDALGLGDVACVQARAETYRGSFDAAVSRAVAALPLLAELCLPLVRVGGRLIAMQSVQSDPDAAQNAIVTLGGRLERVTDYTIPGTDVRHRAVIVEKVRPAPPGYPRPFAKMKKRPL